MMRDGGEVPAIHDVLVERLKADARPVRRLWPPTLRLAVWVALAVTVMATAMWGGLRPDVADALRRPLYLVELAAFLAAAVTAAMAALLAAVPGRARPRAGFVAVGLGAVAVVVVLSEPAPAPAIPAVPGVQCALCVALFGSLPWTALFVAVRRGVPLDAGLAGIYVGGAAFLLGAAVVRIACPVDAASHVLGWHVLPMVAWSALSAVAGAAMLPDWGCATRSDQSS